jgi:hypothetical protein
MPSPLVIQPNASGDRQVVGNHAVWATARAAATGTLDAIATDYIGGQSFLSGVYYIGRSLLLFDTSPIGAAGGTVVSATLGLTPTVKSGNGEIVHAVSTSLTSMTTTSDYAIANYGSTSAAAFAASMSINTTYTQALDLAVVPINISGVTYIGLRGGNDLDNTTPTGLNRFRIASSDHATAAYRPVLTVTYTTGIGKRIWFQEA